MRIREVLSQNHISISSECKKRLTRNALSCERSIIQLQRTLKSLKSKIPNIITHIETIQKQLDSSHYRATSSKVAGTFVGILGGAFIIGGIIAAPFTFGASVGLTITGGIVVAGGAIATTGSKIFDHFQSFAKNNEVRCLVNTIKSLCNEAQDQYMNIQSCCIEIGHILFSINYLLFKESYKDKFTAGWKFVSFPEASTGADTKIGLMAACEAFHSTKGAAYETNILTKTMEALKSDIIASIFLSEKLPESIRRLVVDEKLPLSKVISHQICILKALEAKIIECLDNV